MPERMQERDGCLVGETLYSDQTDSLNCDFTNYVNLSRQLTISVGL